MKKKKQINGFDVYIIKCQACKGKFEGQVNYPSFAGYEGIYCNNCSNLKIWDPLGEVGPINCECGGTFNYSYSLLCPACSNIIHDAEKQLAAQFFIVEPCKVERQPSKKEINIWYDAMRKKGFLTGKELFVQLSKVLLEDENSGEWNYYNRFEK